MGFWENKHILVTGGAGFLGSYLVEEINKRGGKNIFIPTHDKFDLRLSQDIIRMYEEAHPDVVIHLAAKVGGIGENKQFPAEFFYDNLIIGTQIMEYARIYELEKFVAIGTSCAYPKFTKVPFKEKNLWDGYPEETNAPYGLAKKMLLVQAQAYRRQYGFNAVYLLPINLYGAQDNFHLEHSHVIPAIIRKCLEAIENKQDKIVLWGTGKPTREFLYAADCAEAICLAAERYNKPEPVNIGSGFEVSIKDLAKLIVKLIGFKGRVIWDKTKPDGQPRRCLDTTKAEREFGFRAKTDFNEGLKKTIEWYKENYHNLK